MIVAFVAAFFLVSNAFAAESIPHSEYPRPQLQRSANAELANSWRTLNGVWQFMPNASHAYLEMPPDIQAWSGAGTQNINVPFPVESNLSSVGSSIGETGVGFYRLYTDQVNYKIRKTQKTS